MHPVQDLSYAGGFWNIDSISVYCTQCYYVESIYSGTSLDPGSERCKHDSEVLQCIVQVLGIWEHMQMTYKNSRSTFRILRSIPVSNCARTSFGEKNQKIQLVHFSPLNKGNGDQQTNLLQLHQAKGFGLKHCRRCLIELNHWALGGLKRQVCVGKTILQRFGSRIELRRRKWWQQNNFHPINSDADVFTDST